MKGTIGPGRAANARWIECAASTEPVKATPRNARIADETGADRLA